MVELDINGGPTRESPAEAFEVDEEPIATDLERTHGEPSAAGPASASDGAGPRAPGVVAQVLRSVLTALAGACLALGALWYLSGDLRLTPADRTDEVEAEIGALSAGQAAVTATARALAAEVAASARAIDELEEKTEEIARSARRFDAFLTGLRELLVEIDATPTPVRTPAPTATGKPPDARPTATGQPADARPTARPSPRSRVPRPVGEAPAEAPAGG